MPRSIALAWSPRSAGKEAMKMLGIDPDNSFLVYEGSSFWGCPIWPAPTLTAVSIVDESSAALEPDESQRDIRQMDFVLADEGYDPTSRVRKGRLFKRFEGVQPQEWHVQPHPIIPMERQKIDASGVKRKLLGSYIDFSLTAFLKHEGINKPLFILGNAREFTIWSLVEVEAIVSGEPLVYLRSRKVFGALPRLNIGAVPAEHLVLVQGKLDILAEDLYRAGPESVIDRSREAATAILSAYLQVSGQAVKGKDLGALLTLLEELHDKKYVVANLGKTIARLHSRGKTAEQVKRPVRVPCEEDAELAVQAIGLILRDLGWAE